MNSEVIRDHMKMLPRNLHKMCESEMYVAEREVQLAQALYLGEIAAQLADLNRVAECILVELQRRNGA